MDDTNANSSEDEIITKITELIKTNEKGVTEKLLQVSMPEIDPLTRAGAINKLLSQNKIEILRQGDQLLYRAKDVDKSRGTTTEEKIVYSIIENAGNKGIWIREIGKMSNLPQAILTKILKAMESKKLIKSVKPVSASRHKSYILYELEPDVTVTGGSFYSNQDFESEFVEILNNQSYRFLQEKLELVTSVTDPMTRKNKSYAKSQEVANFIRDLGISKIELSLGDIECILETLIFDEKVEKYVKMEVNKVTNKSEKVTFYRAVKRLTDGTGLTSMPCGVCPVIKDCCENGVISPSKCIYFKEWLES